MNTPSAETLGAKIDAVLEPFLKDEARLERQIDKLRRQIRTLKAEVAQIERDLEVVRSAKVDALRRLAAADPVLAAALAPAAAHGSATQNTTTPADPAPPAEQDGHPLLSPA